ncbi:hypothetical protein CYMTET_9174 [Cymbomonas tetramitiformis]|uniref:Uncharacterized protein n=1 Tax=Cymbomonas tetramitiformis TaxID=36881 RepID=A0AAE0LFD8_9CHLO|nr:hypothetical protein CYMTET_9174 [Cymbomonas tetramitiformis]
MLCSRWSETTVDCVHDGCYSPERLRAIQYAKNVPVCWKHTCRAFATKPGAVRRGQPYHKRLEPADLHGRWNWLRLAAGIAFANTPGAVLPTRPTPPPGTARAGAIATNRAPAYRKKNSILTPDALTKTVYTFNPRVDPVAI